MWPEYHIGSRSRGGITILGRCKADVAVRGISGTVGCRAFPPSGIGPAFTPLAWSREWPPAKRDVVPRWARKGRPIWWRDFNDRPQDARADLEWHASRSPANRPGRCRVEWSQLAATGPRNSRTAGVLAPSSLMRSSPVSFAVDGIRAGRKVRCDEIALVADCYQPSVERVTPRRVAATQPGLACVFLARASAVAEVLYRRDVIRRSRTGGS